MEDLEKIAKLVRYYILRMTTKAGSGHPTSSLSAADIMVGLFFRHLRFDFAHPENPNNDRVIFSKGHVSPLIYALYAVAGVITEKELDTYRQFGSPLEGHPTLRFKYAEAATGSLGQGLSIGVGEALALRLLARGPVSSFPPASARSDQKSNGGKVDRADLRADGSPSRTATPRSIDLARGTRDTLPHVYVLMGDSEVAEGSIWEACEIAGYYKLSNLVGIIDVNRLGQSRPTMLEWDVDTYKRRVESFGWDAQIIDGHDFSEIDKAFKWVAHAGQKPKMIIAKTIKGKGVSFLENREGWHGKALSQEDFEKAVVELGEMDRMVRGEISKPLAISYLPLVKQKAKGERLKANYKIGEEIATRKAYGEVLAKLGDTNPDIVSLDGEVSNSTFSEIFREAHPERYFEMFIAEQNMVGTALGMSKRGKIPFVSTFATFFTRAFDQIRMSAYSGANVKFVGSHAGVSIGEDGPSQMGLEDFAMFRAVFGSVVLCPGDAVACAKLVEVAANYNGMVYMRTNRPATPVIYDSKETFKIGGSKLVRSSRGDKLTIVACGVALVESIKAADELKACGVNVRVIDAYSIKPIDEKTLRKAASEVGSKIITVEDHYFDGGLGDAVLNVFAPYGGARVCKLAVSKMPMSGKAEQLLEYESISAKSIVKKILEILK